MITSELIINELLCLGCGYCVEFCPRGCLKMATNKVYPNGYYHPELIKPEDCSGCGICAKMCPHMAIVVESVSKDQYQAVRQEKASVPPDLTIPPSFAGCPGCQHPTVGRIISEVVDELGVGEQAVILEAIPCSLSSAFGSDYGRKLSYNESASDLATYYKRNSPNSFIAAVQGYWGLADFSFDLSPLIGALTRGDKFTMIFCNMPFYGPKDGRPVPATEPVEGRLIPATRINTPEGQKLILDGYPLQVAELVATFKGVAYSARGAITSVKDYNLTKSYIKDAFQKQINNVGFSFVEVICACNDITYSPPLECLKWVKEKMTSEFTLGVFKNVD